MLFVRPRSTITIFTKFKSLNIILRLKKKRVNGCFAPSRSEDDAVEGHSTTAYDHRKVKTWMNDDPSAEKRPVFNRQHHSRPKFLPKDRRSQLKRKLRCPTAESVHSRIQWVARTAGRYIWPPPSQHHPPQDAGRIPNSDNWISFSRPFRQTGFSHPL